MPPQTLALGRGGATWRDPGLYRAPWGHLWRQQRQVLQAKPGIEETPKGMSSSHLLERGYKMGTPGLCGQQQAGPSESCPAPLLSPQPQAQAHCLRFQRQDPSAPQASGPGPRRPGWGSLSGPARAGLVLRCSPFWRSLPLCPCTSGPAHVA